MCVGGGGGGELGAAGLPRRTVAGGREPVGGACVDQGDEGRVAALGPVAGEEQCEGDVEMGADAQRIGELGQEGVEAFGEGGGERCERGAPRGVVTLGLGVEREQPRPAIGALESGGVREIGRASCRERVCQYV